MFECLFSSRRRHTRWPRDWSSDVCSSDLGTRVREGLRDGVEQALLTLGQGFLEHPDNHPLRNALDDGSLSRDQYFQQLLRLEILVATQAAEIGRAHV